MIDCKFRTHNGRCDKFSKSVPCTPSTIDTCDEPVSMVTVEQMCRFSSVFGNTFNFITKAQLNELQEGKAIYINDGEYCHFIVLKEEKK